MSHHFALPPSPWVERWLPQIPQKSRVLDLACGNGRHTAVLLAQGFAVTAVDIDVTAVRQHACAQLEVIEADLEGAAWPLPLRAFGGVVVTNYLWRPLLATIVDSVAPGGVLIYQTFLEGNERLGRPRNPDFLLRSGELQDLVQGKFEVLGFEEGPDGDPPTAIRQGICARRGS